MAFLEALRTYKLLKPETVKLMMTDRLTEEQKRTYWTSRTHGYGLGVRCPKRDGDCIDFGWGGAACALLAIDIENKLTMYFGCHLLNSPAQGIRVTLYRHIYAELIDNSRLEPLYEEMKNLYKYEFTY